MVTARLDHFRVDVSDLDASERFYRDVMGWDLVVRYEIPNGVLLFLGPEGRSPGVELWQELGLTPNPSATQHLGIAVDDVPAMIDHVRALGYKVEEEPRMIAEETIAFVRDPDGHLIEFSDFKGR
jgi:catechol 2,3-dioxygenase-like lactoylglutathione lyase family enzyme